MGRLHCAMYSHTEIICVLNLLWLTRMPAGEGRFGHLPRLIPCCRKHNPLIFSPDWAFDCESLFWFFVIIDFLNLDRLALTHLAVS